MTDESIIPRIVILNMIIWNIWDSVIKLISIYVREPNIYPEAHHHRASGSIIDDCELMGVDCDRSIWRMHRACLFLCIHV